MISSNANLLAMQLRAKIGEMPSVLLTSQQKRQIAKLSGQIESLRKMAAMEILTEFQQKK